MKLFSLTIGLVGMSFLLAGCGDDEPGIAQTPVAACKEGNAVFCGKAFSCFDDAELKLLSGSIGNNETDCNTKLNAECTEDKANCESGKTFQPDKAKECKEQSEDFNCDQVRGFFRGTTQIPAACNQTCS